MEPANVFANGKAVKDEESAASGSRWTKPAAASTVARGARECMKCERFKA